MADRQPTFRVSFHGKRDASLRPNHTQPGQAEVSGVEMHPSGKWLITTCVKSGQVAMVRIAPETTMIIVDVERGKRDA